MSLTWFSCDGCVWRNWRLEAVLHLLLRSPWLWAVGGLLASRRRGTRHGHGHGARRCWRRYAGELGSLSVEVEVLWELEEHGARKLEAGSDLRFLLFSSDLLPRPSLDSRAKLEILNPQKNSYPQTRRERKPNPDFPHVFQPDMRFSRGLVVCRVGKPPN